MKTQERIMHLRCYDYRSGNKWDHKKRGITVVADIIEDDVIYKWAIQNPSDQYSRKEGVRVALGMNGEVTGNWEYDKSPKLQFFNAIAEELCFAYSRVSDASWVDRVSLTFETLLEIADNNAWFQRTPVDMIPNIHPLIFSNYINRNELFYI